MSPSTIYLISGANRGLGLGLVKHILTRNDDAFVYAGVREPSSAFDLIELQKQYANKLAVVKYISADAEGNAAIAKEVESRHGRVDTVIANAGISKSWSMISEVKVDELEEHFNVHVSGTVILFQALQNLLKMSSNPRFVTISSSAGRIGGDLIKVTAVGSVAYGASKAALNWVSRRLHYENDWIIAFPMCPGAVSTDMLNTYVANDRTGMFNQRLSEIPAPETVAPKLLKIIDESTRDSCGGEFIYVNGTKLEW